MALHQTDVVSHATRRAAPGMVAERGTPARHIPTRSAWLRICTPWTSEAPPRMADATCTASVI